MFTNPVEAAAEEAVVTADDDDAGRRATAATPTMTRRRERFRFLRNRKSLVGVAILVFFVIIALVGDRIAPYDPSALSPDLLQPPSWHHWLGTTHMGQDVMSQLLVGTRSVLLVGFIAGGVASVLSVLVGVTAGFLGGAADDALSALANIFLVIPGLPLVIIIAGQLPNAGSVTIAVVLAATGWAWGARVLRAQTLSLRRRDFVEAARANGESTWRIICFETMPNLTAIIASNFVNTVIFAILAQVTLAFIGVTSISDWDWGTVLFWAQNQQALSRGAWWWFVPAGLCIAAVGLALTLINFGIDEFVNPRLRATASGREMRRRKIEARIGFTPVVAGAPRIAASTAAIRADEVGPDRRPILEIRGLHVDYGYGAAPTHALRGVDLTLHEGEVLGLAGESGCGKSTLVYAATRLLPPPGLITGGETLFHPGGGAAPVDILRLSDRELRRSRWQDTAIVFQGAMNSLNPVYRVGRQITDAIAAHRPDWSRDRRDARASELLSMVGIAEDRISAYPHQLSGGMRQRVMIAMALALEPKVLIMDEPTTALDVVMQRQILEEIIGLRDRLGFSVIFITHDISLLIEIADRIAIMYAGEIVEEAGAVDLYRRPRHPYSHGLLTSFPPLHGPRRALAGIPGSPPDLQTVPPGCPFQARCPYATSDCRTTHPPLTVPSIDAGGSGGGRVVACLLHDGCHATPAELSHRAPSPVRTGSDIF